MALISIISVTWSRSDRKRLHRQIYAVLNRRSHPVAHWNEVVPDAVVFDAIRDRLEHFALTINITGPTYRGVKARKLTSKKKDA